MKTSKILFIACLALGTILVSCSGEDGEQGPPGDSIKGDPGNPGDPGDPGEDGLSCWDLNGNGTADITEDEFNEDINLDGVVNALDCQGEQGPQGEQGVFEFFFADFEGLPDSNPPSEFVQSDANNADWLVDVQSIINNDTYNNNYAFISGTIGDGQMSEVSISFTSETTSLIEFDAMSSSEEDWDYLTWSINGEIVQGISGVMTGSVKIRFTAPAGENVLTFTYTKDELCCADGLDIGVIDNLLINNVSNVGKVNLSLPELPEGASYYTERGNPTK
ncbi:collagen-like triple helix repeat-containing protein [Flagellimonas sp.]|uniref:collagen-like triple helix repeat-containing protein n=1 Tax=Flagellimonas sp. TaxID=2058762 RepID=UPI003BAB9651